MSDDVTALLTAIRDFISLPGAGAGDMRARDDLLRHRAAWLGGYIGDGTGCDPARMTRDLARAAAASPVTWEPCEWEPCEQEVTP